MKDLKPTVGVYYKSYGTPNGEYGSKDRADIITGVVDDTTIHLAVLNPTKLFFNHYRRSLPPRGFFFILESLFGLEPATERRSAYVL